MRSLSELVILLTLLLSGCNSDSIDSPNRETIEYSYPIVGTRVNIFYNNNSVIVEPEKDEPFYGQDAHYHGNNPDYIDNENGTISDVITGLVWQKVMGDKITWEDAFVKADTMILGGYDDWRVPTIKELYSLIDFNGLNGGSPENSVKFINTQFFDQPWGNTDEGERYIDAQTWTSTQYVGTTMNSDVTIFGVNFIDGRIKGYPKFKPRTGGDNIMYFRMVRGNNVYGKNNFHSNGDGTVSDLATGLMWQKADDGNARDWKDALSYAENLEFAGHNDWRLPNAKELQSIVDYSRAPDITGSAAIDPVFECTEIVDPDGNSGHYPYYWSSTTHLDGKEPATAAVYIAFGKALGYMNGKLLDVHGAGAQRSDPKTGNPEDYPSFWGPQGDVRYVFNYVRCVRNIDN